MPGDQPVDAEDGTVITIKRVALPDVRDAPAGSRREIPDGPFWPRLSDPAEVYAALVTGVRDYVRKNGFRSAILALSGGIDSALTATIAADAIGPDNVHVVLMPSRYSSEHSVTDAEDLVKRQGVHALTIPIASMVDAFTEELAPAGFPERRAARGEPAGPGARRGADGAVQRRRAPGPDHRQQERDGDRLLDPVRGLGRRVRADQGRAQDHGLGAGPVAQRRGGAAGATPPIPENSITKPPSAELAPGQLDTDSLPPYEVLDALLDDYVEKDMGSAELIAAGHDPALVERVIRLVDAAEYKRRQYPPGPKISQKNFGRDRRLPITNRWREHCGPA